jgi:hypothetical protein
MREIQDEEGRTWQVVSVDTPVAHVRTGARLAFRPADDPDAEPLLSNVTFNSHNAAALAIRNMSTKEVLRRLSLASANSAGLLNDPDTFAPPAFGGG